MPLALARACVTSVSTVRSWAAKPFTVSTRLGMRSARAGRRSGPAPIFVDVLLEADELVLDADRPDDDADDEHHEHGEGDERCNAYRSDYTQRRAETLPRYRVTATNTSSGENKIHDDATARRYGLPRGARPRRDVYAYMTQPLVAAFGSAWLARGTAAVRFVKPVLEGEELLVSGVVTARDPQGVTATLTGATAATPECATLTVTIPAGLPTPSTWPATARRRCRAASRSDPRALGVARHARHAARALRRRRRRGVRRQGEPSRCRSTAAPAAGCTPGFLLEQGNRAVDRNVTMGRGSTRAPRCATSAARRRRRAAGIAAQGALRSSRRRRRLRGVDLVITAGRARASVAHLLHTAIYRLPSPSDCLAGRRVLETSIPTGGL